MIWGTPSALLLMLGALPLILFLHSLKPRGLKVSTTALFIWERVLKERPLATRLGWLMRKNLLLILQLLAAAVLIAALADPQLLHFSAPAGDTVVVMDLTASMGAKGPSGTRFDAARREFSSLIDAMPGNRRMMLIGAGPETRLIVPFTSDKKRLKEAARNLTPTHSAGRVKDAILFAHAFLKKGSPDRVVVISDAAFPGAEEFDREATYLKFIKVEGGPENTGIVGLDIRRHPDGSERYEVLAHVRNFGTQTVRTPLILTLGQTVLARHEVELGADSRQVLVYSYEGSLAGTLTAQLEIDDDFATDNRAALSLSASAPVRILYVGPGNPFLTSLFRFFPSVQLTTVEHWQTDGTGRKSGQESVRGSAFDVLIFDRVTPPELNEGNVIFIDTVAPNLPLSIEGELRRPRFSTTLTKHPLTSGLALGDLHVQEALRVTARGDSIVLARAAHQPVLVAYERARLRALFIGFDLMASDLPFRVAFPVLFHNTLEWFRPGRREFPADAVKAGSPMPIFVPPGDRMLEITTPSGRNEVLEVANSPVLFKETFETGVYTYQSPGRQGYFAVNLLDEEESNISARGSETAPAVSPSAAEHRGGEAGFPLWPFLLIAVLLVLFSELWLAYRMRLARPPLVLRACAVGALLVAWFNPKFFRPGEALDVIVGVDLSRSVGQTAGEKALELLEAAARITDVNVRTGLLAFGRAPEWEFPPRRDFPVADIGVRVDREETDIQAALQAGMAQIGEGRQGKVLLVSDGNENRGTSARMIPILRSQGTQVWTVPVSLARGRNEIFISDLILPRQVDSGEAFPVVAKLESLRAASARIKLLRDGNLGAERELQLHPGVNEVSFSESLREAGSHSYELLVESPDDTLAENNLLQGVVEVKGPPRVLLLSAQPESQRFIARALRAQGFTVVESAPEASGLALAELSSYDLLILDNVPAFQLSHAKMENIEKYVRDLGGGLFVIGGSQSYGAGGYFRTPLERILPVEMRPPARLDFPHVALLFVLDKSGSMGAGAEGSTKLDLAKAAAIAAADIMNPTDQIGILAFDAAWDWALPFRPVGKGEWINDKLAALQSDGGTDLYKALVEARRAIVGKEAAIKHVIVLSDGLTDKADFQSLVQQMAAAGVTVSTVSVGNDADVKLMAEIAREGKGRGYVALDPQTIPQIFTTETLLISRDLLIEKTVMPRVVAPVGPLRGLGQAALPALHGYVLTYPKQRADVLMRAGEDPLLVVWRHGLGRVTAFTSDLSGRWGKEWVAWSGLPQWGGQLARDTMRKTIDGGMRTEFHADGESVRVVADLFAKDGGFMNHLKLRGNISAPNRSTEQSVFQQSAPGRYEGKFAPAERGIHFLTLFADGNGVEAPLSLVTVPYVAPFPKEYRSLRPNYALLSRLAEETGGEMLDPENFAAGVKRLYTPASGKAAQGQESWWPFGVAALCLFLADLVMRTWPRTPQGALAHN